jgi:Holliday junction resolvase RusA-like endonuclease
VKGKNGAGMSNLSKHINRLVQMRCPEDDESGSPELINSVHFALPALPLSVNSLYEIWWSTRQVKLKVECLSWKTRAKEHMPLWKLQSADSLICVEAHFFYNFYYKNQSLRKVDTQNLMKLLIDAVAERYGFDDKRVKRTPVDSFNSKQERAIVTVSEYFIGDGEMEMKKGD